MENIIPNNSDTVKKSVERSASYPCLSIDDAIDFVGKISKNFTAAQVITREDMGAVIGASANYIARDVAACVQYGLLTRQSKGYQITSLFKSIINPIDEKEKKKLLLEALSAPKLYGELIAKFDSHAIPAELKVHLIRFHKITEGAAPEAASIFIKSARYVGALNDNNILNVADLIAKLNNSNVQFAEVITEEKTSDDIGNRIELKQTKEREYTELLLPNGSQEENVKIPLPGRRYAILSYPSDLTKKDIEILNKQIELLGLVIAE